MTSEMTEWLAVGRLYNALADAERAVKGEDDHYYGAWFGGSAASGGHPTGRTSWPKPDMSHSGIEDATSAWSGTHFADVRSYMRTGRIRPGSSVANDPIHGISNDRVAQSVSTLTEAVANGPEAPTLYRGLNVDAGTAAKFAGLEAGSSVDMSLTSWSASADKAAMFSGGATGRGGNAVTLKLTGGAKGFDMSPHSFYPEEKEWLTDGRFIVHSVESGPNGTTVSLSQKAVFASPSAHSGLKAKIVSEKDAKYTDWLEKALDEPLHGKQGKPKKPKGKS